MKNVGFKIFGILNRAKQYSKLDSKINDREINRSRGFGFKKEFDTDTPPTTGHVWIKLDTQDGFSYLFHNKRRPLILNKRRLLI
jgi:hypothetical protein